MQNNLDKTALLKIAIKAACESGKGILEVYNKPNFESQVKTDSSPLTEADLLANQIISEHLNATGVPVINEEIKNEKIEVRSTWKNCWIVDPLDGTKEFIKRNGEFTVNIALASNGSPAIGVLYVPVMRHLYYTIVEEKKAYKTLLNENHQLQNALFDEKDRILPNEDPDKLRIVGSRSHMNQDTLDYIDSLKPNKKEIEIVSKGSSLKFCLVAEGQADIYPRFAPTMEWDTAAGHAICNAVGLEVIAQDTQKPLLYNKENLLNPYFLIRN